MFGEERKIFEEKEVISEFCFRCYKVQVEVSTVLDLIRLSAVFYEIEFESDLTPDALRPRPIALAHNLDGMAEAPIFFCLFSVPS